MSQKRLNDSYSAVLLRAMDTTKNQSKMSAEGQLHIVTPLIHSLKMSDIAKIPVFLKCDNSQPTGSFKLRGLGNMMTKCHNEGIRNVVIASGGNAGLAVAYSAHHLGMDATVVCPNTTATEVCDEIQRLGSKIVRHGWIWDEANKEALRISADEERTFIHPFEHPFTWEGHATVIDEIREQLQGQKPGCIVVAVGGGGYIAGTLQGLKKHNWTDVPVVAVETIGTACFNESIKCGKLITKENMKGIAHSLKSKQVTRCVFEAAVNKEHPILSVTVSDDEALDACFRFFEHHGFLVEPACGAVLASIYSGIISNLVAEGQVPDTGPAVVLVCGGALVTIEKLQNWKIELSNSIS